MLVAMMAGGPAPAAKPLPDHLFGPPPDWSRFRAIAEAGLASRLIDPESARITWLGAAWKGGYKPLLAAPVQGYVACGTVNARNRMGGYVGAKTFIVVVDYERVLYADIDTVSGGLIDKQCADAQRSGLMPPLPAMTPSGDGDARTKPPSASGLTVRAMPDGAYVSAVAPGSLAAAAGLKPGMVVASVNAIPLASMGDAMIAVLNAAGPGATLTLVGGTMVRIGARP
jgi:membrane-associated protease RseP (regulator of RpoE activity)